MNYKVLFIYEENGIGKEYNIYNDALMFVGEYIKGIKNGKGKEYKWNNLVVFEGEYLNGKRNGKGKEYNYRQDVIFEGEYFNGLKNGKGKEYYYNYPIFEGEYLSGKRWNGKGYDILNRNIAYNITDGNVFYR